MTDLITNIICVMLGAIIAGFFQLRSTNKTVNQDVLLERTKVYKRFYFMFVLKYNSKYWMSFSGFFQQYYDQLTKEASEQFLLLDPVSKKYMKNICRYFKCIQRKKRVNKLYFYLIRRNLKKLRFSIDKEFMNIQSKRGYPVGRIKYFAANFCMFIELLSFGLLISIENLYSLVSDPVVCSTIFSGLLLIFLANSVYLYKTKEYLDIF